MSLAPRAVVGLKNVGNTCFLNAVLQSLASVRSFSAYVHQAASDVLPHHPDINKKALHERSLVLAFKDTLEKLKFDNTSFEPPITRVTAVKNRFLTSEQQDAHEFMQYVVTLLSEESESLTSSSPGLHILKDLKAPASLASLVSHVPHVTYSTKSMSILSIHSRRNPFAGMLKSTLECTSCRRRSIPSYQKFIDLSLSIPEKFIRNETSPTLEDCLELFTQTELVSDVDCSSCANLIHAKKRLTIARAPKTLCLHIRRLVSFGGPLVKLNSHIQFPLELDLAPFCSFTEPSGERSVSPQKKSLDVAASASAPKSNNRRASLPTSATEHRRSPSKLEQILNGRSGSSIVGGTLNYEQHPTSGRSAVERLLPRQINNSARQVKSPESDGGSLKYDLVSVIVHHGNHAGGHYTVYRKLLADSTGPSPVNTSSLQSNISPTAPCKSRWYHISDEHSRPVSEDEVLQSQAYMLYYEKCDDALK